MINLALPSAPALPTGDLPAELPLVQLTEQLLAQAMTLGASDVHLEPCGAPGYRVRLRIDGMLRTADHYRPSLARRLVVRLKLMARLDIAEQRLPQDGQFSFSSQGHDCAFRLSTLPALAGEKLVLRLLPGDRRRFSLRGLGMPKPLCRQFLHLLRHPHGLVLLTGPTGSGKTQTLYSALHYLRRQPLNICSAEDPIEYPLTGISQCQVNPRAGVTFALLLRALLRQDPDVIMIGEIRDSETAALALRAAGTGHLVLATLHCLSAGAAPQRLAQLGLDVGQAGPLLRLVLAQRLVRRLCLSCRQPAIDGSWQASGCPHCRHGYAGRCGLFHLLCAPAVGQSPASARWVTDKDGVAGIGTEGLHQAGLELVRQGITSREEICRVLGATG